MCMVVEKNTKRKRYAKDKGNKEEGHFCNK
jgi:hypothetical protein